VARIHQEVADMQAMAGITIAALGGALVTSLKITRLSASSQIRRKSSATAGRSISAYARGALQILQEGGVGRRTGIAGRSDAIGMDPRSDGGLLPRMVGRW
jgi:hypothetical protein